MSNKCYENLEVKKSFCIFSDILGFKNKIITCKTIEETNELLKNFNESINVALKFLEENLGWWEFKLFSDNVFLGLPLKEHHSEDYFGIIIDAVTNYQLSLVMDNWFVRGAWELKNVYMDDKMVFGEGVINSYLLESKEAKYPRIILSGNMKMLVNEHLDYYSKNCVPQENYILQDEKGIYFINYLIIAIEYDGKYACEILEKHKKIIHENMKFSEKKIYKKYLWCAFYHNRFCELYLSNIDETLKFDSEIFKEQSWEISKLGENINKKER